MGMLNYLLSLGGDMVRMSNRLDRTQWMIAMGIVCGLGLLCMRGFGSRKDF